MRLLAIETSCDETAAAVVEDGRRVLSNVVSTQVAIHSPFGGVVPELASRHHIENIVPVVREALARAEVGLPDIDRPDAPRQAIPMSATARVLAYRPSDQVRDFPSGASMG